MRLHFHYDRVKVGWLWFAVVGMACASCSTVAVTDPVVKTAAGQQTQGKPGSGVVIRYGVPEKIAVGELVTLRLQFSGVTAADGAMVEVRDPSTRTTLVSTFLVQGEQRTIELPYRSDIDGMQFMDVTTTQGGRVTVQSVPLRVGSGELRLKTEGKTLTTTTGERVISLPAAER